ncbi:hypothetical protein FH972_021500 [Carpinus fangiana]|uniref:Translin n=1 Tax=Carpinus fangiana TaxID=176857 RepID=A0A5N6KPH6_9ROSI|nr:hypothetical protein FH972_021500 [Carpinus fangiana]
MTSNDGGEGTSPYMSIFEGFRNELDQHHDRRERCIKASRDITAASKKIIFALQRVRTLGSVIPENISRTTQPYYDTIYSSFAAVAPDLQGLNAHRYARNITGGLQEYMEAISFQYYLEKQEIITREAAEAQLNQGMQVEARIAIGVEDYILGLYDMTGELMRFAITNMATVGGVPQARHDGDGAEISNTRTVLSDLRELSFRLETLDSGSDFHFARDASKKLVVTKQSVDKVERAVYGLLIRGSERPKGWMPDLSDAPREEIEGF